MHANYGTTDGIKYNLTEEEYARLRAASPSQLSDAQILHFRHKANAKLDSILVAVVGKANIPLPVVPDELHGISDDLTTFFILRSKYRKVEPNKSDWVDEFKTLAMDNLKLLMGNADNFVDALGNIISVDGFDISTLDYDPIFGMERTVEGERVTGDYEESQEDW
jgi:hypothetical protein